MWWGFIERLVFPPAGPLLLGLLGLWFWRRSVGRLAVFAAFGVLYALSTPLVSTALVAPLERVEPLQADALDGQRPGVIVVLAGGYLRHTPEYEGGSVNLWSLERARYAARLQRRLDWPVLVSGGPDEGDALGALLENEFDVPVRWVDSDAGNTQENAYHTAELLEGSDARRIVLVTKALHYPRALSAFERAGLDNVTPAPTGYFHRPDPEQGPSIWSVIPGMPNLTQSYMALHEYVGRLWYWVRYDILA